MPFFVVKRDLPGVTPEALQSAGMRAKSCCAEMTGEGQPVRWVRSFYLPETAQTHCYFEAAARSAAEEANQRAHPVHADCGSGGDDAGNGVNEGRSY
ncbi:MAG TPA: nickel-binding protein [Bryobacteraceae bacterium]|nr:nickel-binding protein [Bryobacteraceae bacterium]